MDHECNRWLFRRFGGINIAYREHLDGGGTTFGQEYVALFERLGLPKQRRVFEWCAGPGFIGFSLLGHGMCESLCLADINPEAILACEETISRNGLSDRVRVYHSDNLSSIPQSERWDLVVGNPPHFAEMARFDGPLGYELRVHDRDWQIHQGFFSRLGDFLKPGGVAIIQENNQGSVPSDFTDMIRSGGLRPIFNIGGKEERPNVPNYYFLGVARQNDRLPHWVGKAT